MHGQLKMVKACQLPVQNQSSSTPPTVKNAVINSPCYFSKVRQMHTALRCVWLQERSVIAPPGKDCSEIWVVLAFFKKGLFVSIYLSVFLHFPWIQGMNNCHIPKVTVSGNIPSSTRVLASWISECIWVCVWGSGYVILRKVVTQRKEKWQIVQPWSFLSLQWATFFTLENRERANPLTRDLKTRLELQLSLKTCVPWVVTQLFGVLVPLAMKSTSWCLLSRFVVRIKMRWGKNKNVTGRISCTLSVVHTALPLGSQDQPWFPLALLCPLTWTGIRCRQWSRKAGTGQSQGHTVLLPAARTI